MQKYDDMTKGIKNGKPVYVELEVVDMGKADDGFAADYEGVYQIMTPPPPPPPPPPP